MALDLSTTVCYYCSCATSSLVKIDKLRQAYPGRCRRLTGAEGWKMAGASVELWCVCVCVCMYVCVCMRVCVHVCFLLASPSFFWAVYSFQSFPYPMLCLIAGPLRPCQTSGLAAAVAKQVSRRGTAFDRVYVDSFVKRWLMSHGRSNRLTAAVETHVLAWNRRGSPA